MHPSVFTELLINLLTFLPFHWKLKLTSIRAIKNGVQRRHYVIFVGFGYKKSLGSSFFGAWADFHWNCERSFWNTANIHIVQYCKTNTTINISLLYYAYTYKPIEGFLVTSYQARSASHHARDRRVGFLFARTVLEKTQQNVPLLFIQFIHGGSMVHTTVPKYRNISTHTQLKC